MGIGELFEFEKTGQILPERGPVDPLVISASRQNGSMPWDLLFAHGWRIVGMNHYRLDGKECLFCDMIKDGRCIVAEGPQDIGIFKWLEEKAGLKG